MAASFLRWLLYVLASTFQRPLAFLRRGWPPPHVAMDEVTINVQFSTNLAISVTVKRDCTVKAMKERLASQLDVPVQELRVIFAGKELRDDAYFKDCNIEEYTTVHAVRSAACATPGAEPVVSAEMCCAPLGGSLAKAQLTEEERLASTAEVDKTLFFVYCKSPCGRVEPGKLRVRCATCGQGCFLLDREPSCWPDVLERGRLGGRCEQEGCGGRLADFFFKCASSNRLEGHDQRGSTVLPLVRCNFLGVPCLSCTDVSRIVLVFPCTSSHVICLECFGTYCRSRLDERGFVQHPQLGSTLPCPVGCDDSFIQETHHFCLLGPEQYQRYQRFAAEEFVLQAGGVLCPQPGCGQGILVDLGCTRVTCEAATQGCGFVFCRLCLQGHHLGPCIRDEEDEASAALGSVWAYPVDEAQARGSRWDEASRLTVRSTTKPCPMCRTPTERDGGCMHMICSRSQCGFQWCWLCQTEWSRNCMGAHWFG
uniref:E3 ubiquitin-protein ligase parkin n=1 Tax=Ixodes ricinus TaxID=34613 RepID=V5IIZ0_IXORI